MKLLLVLLLAAALPCAARAGESGCWFEAGVLVAPAEVAGIAGDFVLDTGAATTLLADTQAQGAGYAETAFSGTIRLAGDTLPPRPLRVEALDARLRALPTPVAGVIGADALAGRVLDVRFAPCRIVLSEPAQAPAFRAEQVLGLRWLEGRPAAHAAVSDGVRALAGDFVLATGSDTPVRLAEAVADVPGARDRQALLPYGELRPKLRALSFAGRLYENLPSGLVQAGPHGEIGAPALSAWTLRFDFAASRLYLAQAKGPPDRSSGPQKASDDAP